MPRRCWVKVYKHYNALPSVFDIERAKHNCKVWHACTHYACVGKSVRNPYLRWCQRGFFFFFFSKRKKSQNDERVCARASDAFILVKGLSLLIVPRIYDTTIVYIFTGCSFYIYISHNVAFDLPKYDHLFQNPFFFFLTEQCTRVPSILSYKRIRV